MMMQKGMASKKKIKVQEDDKSKAAPFREEDKPQLGRYALRSGSVVHICTIALCAIPWHIEDSSIIRNYDL